MVYSAGPVFALYRKFFLLLFLFLFISLSSFILFYLLSSSRFETLSPKYQAISLENIDRLDVIQLPGNALVSTTEKRHCTYWDCFNVYKCGEKGNFPSPCLTASNFYSYVHDIYCNFSFPTSGLKHVSVYVYPLQKFVDGSNLPVDKGISKEMYLLLKAIISSKYYTADPHEACIYVPSLDTLSHHRYNSIGVSQALASLPL